MALCELLRGSKPFSGISLDWAQTFRHRFPPLHGPSKILLRVALPAYRLFRIQQDSNLSASLESLILGKARYYINFYEFMWPIS